MNYSYFAQEIKDRISAKEAFTFYGIAINQKGFANCPFHRERTASMKVYDGNRGYYCFGCGKSGDVIAFVRDYFGLSFVDAIKKLNKDFSLGFPIGEKISRNRQRYIAKQAYNRRKAIKDREKEKERLESEYWAAFDEVLRLNRQLEQYKPKTEDEEWHPKYVEAAQNIIYKQYLLECAESARYEYEKSND